MNIYEAAKKAGVSIATVSRVINGASNVKSETRYKVEQVLKEMDYSPSAVARSLATSSSNTIGVLASDVRDSYYAGAIYCIEQEFRSLGYNVILCNTGGQLDKKQAYLQVLLDNKVDGIILVGSVFIEKSSNRHILDTAKKVPVVMLNGQLDGENIYSIVCDDSHATESIVTYLYNNGHRDIVYLYDSESYSGIAKKSGFVAGAQKHGLSLNSSSIQQVEPGFLGGYNGISKLLEEKISFTAVVTSEDIVAAGAMKRISESGLSIPKDVVVFGFNNSQLCLCTSPDLSSVDNKVNVMSTGAVRLLFDVLSQKEVSSKTTITPELVLRQSTNK